MGLAVVLLGTTLPCLGAPGAEGAENAPSPGSYRVPRWIEEIGTADQPAAPRKTPLRRTKPVGTAAAPLPGTVPQTLAPVAATPLTIAATPAADSDGKPGRALLRSRTPSNLDPQIRLVSGWGALGDEALLGPPQAAEFTDDDETAAPKTTLGPEASVLTVSDSEPVAAPAKTNQNRWR